MKPDDRSLLHDLRWPLVGLVVAFVIGATFGDCRSREPEPLPLEAEVERFDDHNFPPPEEPR